MTCFFKFSNPLTILVTGFDLTTCDLYYTILVEVLTKHILAVNTYFTNHIE